MEELDVAEGPPRSLMNFSRSLMGSRRSDSWSWASQRVLEVVFVCVFPNYCPVRLEDKSTALFYHDLSTSY